MRPARPQPAVPLVDSEHHEPPARPAWWNKGGVWTTRDELAFIRGLGHWRRLQSVADRAQLLRGYLEGLALRKRWTDLQREPLECEARLMLRQLQAGPKP